MKRLKKLVPAFVFALMLCSTTTVFASQLYSTTISVGRGETKQTSKYSMPSGDGRLNYEITKINGSSSKSDANSTMLHIIMRDGNDSNMIDVYKTYDQTYLGSYVVIDGTKSGAKGNWYAQFSTKIDGINYASFYSKNLNLASLTS